MIWKVIPGYNIYKYLYYKVRYPKSVKIGYGAVVGNNSILEDNVEIYAYSYFCGKIGFGSYISSYCNIRGIIGRFTSIAPGVKVIAGMHPVKEPFATTSPYFYSLRSHTPNLTFATKNTFVEYKYADDKQKYNVVIGSDCWIGYDALLVSGITIGNGAVVLAGAVVTKDIPPYAIVAGVPAKIIGFRYDDETICWLEKCQWWNKSILWLKENWLLFNDINKLRAKLDNKNE